MPFGRNDVSVLDSILSAMSDSGVKGVGPQFSGHAPVVNRSIGNGIGDLLGKVFTKTVSPWWYGDQVVHGHGTPAPDSVYTNRKGWEENPQGGGQSLLEQLLGLALGQNSNADFSSQAHAAVNAQYDPQIEELKRQMGLAQGRADRGRTQIGNMYNSLSQSDMADVPVIDKMFQQGGNTLDKQYSDLRNQVSGDYNNAQKEQMDLMTKLNIQAAAPDTLSKQQQDKSFFLGQQGQSHQDTTDAMKLLQTGADNFSTQGAEIARGEGANRQADLLTQLQDYMSQATGKIGDLNLAKQNAYTSALDQLQGQDYQHQQDTFTKLLDIAKLQQSGIQGSMGQYKAGPLAASQYLGQNSPQNASALNSFLMEVLQQPQITSGQTALPDGRTTNLTPEAAAQLAQQKAAEAGMSPESQRQLYLAMLAYYGRVY